MAPETDPLVSTSGRSTPAGSVTDLTFGVIEQGAVP